MRQAQFKDLAWYAVKKTTTDFRITFFNVINIFFFSFLFRQKLQRHIKFTDKRNFDLQFYGKIQYISLCLLYKRELIRTGLHIQAFQLHHFKFPTSCCKCFHDVVLLNGTNVEVHRQQQMCMVVHTYFYCTSLLPLWFLHRLNSFSTCGAVVHSVINIRITWGGVQCNLCVK